SSSPAQIVTTAHLNVLVCKRQFHYGMKSTTAHYPRMILKVHKSMDHPSSSGERSNSGATPINTELDVKDMNTVREESVKY
ncbi:MAG: hypothetical protein P8X85_22615, partial [Desulfobacterales bacterium]